MGAKVHLTITPAELRVIQDALYEYRIQQHMLTRDREGTRAHDREAARHREAMVALLLEKL